MDLINNHALNNISSPQPNKIGPFKNPKAIIAIIIFLITIFPLLVYFGVKSQQNLQSRAENDPACTSNAGYNCTNQGSSWCEGNNRCICGNDAFTHTINNPWCDADGKYYECQNSNKTKIADSCPGAPTPTTGGGSFTPRPPEQVCTEPPNNGTITDVCTADPNCKANGGVCCNISSGVGNYCCYGDSATKKDGTCYAGQIDTLITCDDASKTITNKATYSVKIRHFVGSGEDIQCPISTPDGPDTDLAPNSSVSALGCEQIEAINPETGRGWCGVCNDSSCGGDNPPTTPSQPSPTPTASPPGQCRNVGIYDTSWSPITDLTTLKAGQIIKFTTRGTIGGSYDLGRFRVNGGTWLPSVNGTAQISPNGEYYYEYTIPTGITSFTIEAMVHETTEGWK